MRKGTALGFWECSREWHIQGFFKVKGVERVRRVDAPWSEFQAAGG